MLDQNISTLLAALIGGLLSVIGGLSANYYLHYSSDKISKRKEIRNMLEQVYKHTQSIKASYLLIESKKTMRTTSEIKEDNHINFQEIDACIAKIELLVDFYLPPLKASFSEYYSKDKRNNRDWTWYRRVINCNR